MTSPLTSTQLRTANRLKWGARKPRATVAFAAAVSFHIPSLFFFFFAGSLSLDVQAGGLKLPRTVKNKFTMRSTAFRTSSATLARTPITITTSSSPIRAASLRRRRRRSCLTTMRCVLSPSVLSPPTSAAPGPPSPSPRQNPSHLITVAASGRPLMVSGDSLWGGGGSGGGRHALAGHDEEHTPHRGGKERPARHHDKQL